MMDGRDITEELGAEAGPAYTNQDEWTDRPAIRNVSNTMSAAAEVPLAELQRMKEEAVAHELEWRAQQERDRLTSIRSSALAAAIQKGGATEDVIKNAKAFAAFLSDD